MEWARSASEHDHLTQIRTDGYTTYYVQTGTLYQVDNQPVPGVIYGFYKDQFFAVYISLRAPNQFYYMQRRFSTQYGEPAVTSEAAGSQTIYRWKDGDVKIKLKTSKTGDKSKLAIYYAPLSTALNQEQLEEAPFGAQSVAPAEPSKSVKSAPLLEE